MKSLHINESGTWLGGVSFSLAVHLAAAAALIAPEMVQSIDKVGPITVELVVVNKTAPQSEPNTGETQTGDPETENRIMALGKSNKAALTVLSPTKSWPRKSPLVNALDATPDHVSSKSIQEPHNSQIVVASSENLERQHPSTDGPRFFVRNIPETAQALSLFNEGPPPKSINSVPPKPLVDLVLLGTNAPQAPQNAKPLVISRVPQKKPAAPLLESPDPHSPPETEIVTAKEVKNSDTSIHTAFRNILPPAPASDDGPIVLVALSFSEVMELGKGQSTDVTEPQVAGVFRPLPGTPGISRGVQVLAGNKPPKYPLAARRLGLEGRVILRAEVDSNGTTSRVVITESSGYRILDNAGQKAVRRWQFLPAVVDGTAVSGAVDVPFTFRLD